MFEFTKRFVINKPSQVPAVRATRSNMEPTEHERRCGSIQNKLLFKKTAVAIVFLTISICIGCIKSSKDNAANLQATDYRRDVDLGDVTQGSRLSHVFAIRNTTSKDIQVVELNKSCGCHDTDLEVGSMIAPGELCNISYSTVGNIAVKQSAKLTIKTDSIDDSLNEIVLSLSGTVLPRFIISPKSLIFNTDSKNAELDQQLRIEPTSLGNVNDIRDIVSASGLVSTEIYEKSQKIVAVRVIPSQSPQSVASFDNILTRFNDRSQPSLIVPVQFRATSTANPSEDARGNAKGPS